MSSFETFFACSFVSTFAVALIATWFRYVPALISLYRIFLYRWSQPTPENYTTHKFKFYIPSDRQAQPQLTDLS